MVCACGFASAALRLSCGRLVLKRNEESRRAEKRSAEFPIGAGPTARASLSVIVRLQAQAGPGEIAGGEIGEEELIGVPSRPVKLVRRRRGADGEEIVAKITCHQKRVDKLQKWEQSGKKRAGECRCCEVVEVGWEG